MLKNKNILFIILLGIIFSCHQEKNNNSMDEESVTDFSTTIVDSTFPNTLNTIEQPISTYEEAEKPIVEEPISYTKYGFIVFETYNKLGEYTGTAEGISCSSIVELPAYMSEDEKYKLLDLSQNELFRYKTEVVTGRELKIYDSYAEASKAREMILGYK